MALLSRAAPVPRTTAMVVTLVDRVTRQLSLRTTTTADHRSRLALLLISTSSKRTWLVSAKLRLASAESFPMRLLPSASCGDQVVSHVSISRHQRAASTATRASSSTSTEPRVLRLTVTMNIIIMRADDLATATTTPWGCAEACVSTICAVEDDPERAPRGAAENEVSERTPPH